MEKLEK